MPIPNLMPLGVGDLKVVKQRLARYEAGEISHIENVLAKEKRLREHRSLRQYEETTTIEQSREEENLRDVQSTERFEIESESQRTIKSDTSFQAGLDVSATYGPVSVTASAKFAMTSAKEESDRQATKYAKDVTDRTLARLVEKTRALRTIRMLQETEEKNEHGFDNTGIVSSNISGVYRWVDKYYRNKVVDYGKRVFYEFIVPEPAVFYLFATLYNLNSKVLPEKPDPPTIPNTSIPLTPSSISRTNYLTLLKQYAAEGIEPPPPEHVLVGKAFAGTYGADTDWAFANEELKVPKGYTANWGAYSMHTTFWDDDNPSAVFQVGTTTFTTGGGSALQLLGESDSVPITANGYELLTLAANIEVMCDLRPQAFQSWQLKTFSAIMTAYRKALMDYEDKLAASQINPNAQLGSNPDINRETERRELRRACIELWSGMATGNISAIKVDPNAAMPGNYPEVDIPMALGMDDVVRFFEESFEWNNMTYELYPYYWGRRSVWADNYSLQCNDPLFEQFLKAGSARVVVPVKPSQTERVLYYQLSGVIWSGGSVPSLSTFANPEAVLYNSYLQEIEGIPDAPDIDRDVPIAPDDPESWLVKVPTALVWLQPDSTLPSPEP